LSLSFVKSGLSGNDGSHLDLCDFRINQSVVIRITDR